MTHPLTRHLLILGSTLIIAGSALADPNVDPVDDYRGIHLFFETLERVQGYYVEDISTEELLRMAIDGIVKGLDDHSRFLDPEDFESLRAKTEGRFHGVGVMVAIRAGYPTVISPVDGTPAQRQGVRAGDRIVSIDDESTAGMDLDDVVVRLRGEIGSRVTLGIERGSEGRSLTFEIERARIEVESVVGPLLPSPDIGYIRIRRFSERTAEEFLGALDELEARNVTSVVIDVRGNPGGLLSQAVEIGDRFVPAGEVIVEVRSRNQPDCRTYRAHAGPKWTGKVAVLVDEGSASAAEIVAGAIQDHRVGTVIGQPTFGKGSVQSIFAFDEAHALKLTTAHYYTPSGRSVERRPLKDEPLASLDAAVTEVATAEPGAGEAAADDAMLFTGGIHPDILVEVEPEDSLLIELVSQGLITAFINTPEAAAVDLSHPLDADYIGAFRAYVAERADIPVGSLSDASMDRALREELALRDGGHEAATRVRLQWEPHFRQAVEALRQETPEVAVVRIPPSQP